MDPGRYVLHAVSAYVLLGLVVVVVFDVDRDGQAGWQEFGASSSAFQADMVDADGDGIPDVQEPGRDHVPDIHIELVLADRHMDPARIEALVPRLTAHMQELGFRLVVHVTPGTQEKAVEPIGFGTDLVMGSRFLEDPYVRIALVVREIAPGPLGVSDGRAHGHGILLHHGAFEDHPQYAGRLLLHELGHTLGLCHAHEAACINAMPAAERDMAPRSVMSYEGDTSGPWIWTPSQVDDLQRGLDCMPAQMHREPDASVARQVEIKGFGSKPSGCGHVDRVMDFFAGWPGPAWPLFVACGPVAAMVALAGQIPRGRGSRTR